MSKTYYTSTDFPSYISKFDVNSSLDDYIGKIMYLDFSTYGCINVITDESEPTDLNTMMTVGNYQLRYYINGPTDLMNISPIHLLVFEYNGILVHVILFMMDIYYREYDGTSWSSWETKFNSECPIYKGNAVPTPETAFGLWIDTTNKDLPVIRGYKSDEGWFVIGSVIDILNMSIYDLDKRCRDIYLYFEEKIGMIEFNSDGTYNLIDSEKTDKVTLHNMNNKFKSHFDLGHITEEERERFYSLITKTEFKEKLELLREEFIKYIDTRIENNFIPVEAHVVSNNKHVDDHINRYDIHTTKEAKKYWDNKEDKDHTHDCDDKVTIGADDIVSGIIDIDRFSPVVLERLVRVRTHAERFSLTTFDVQNGDTVNVSEKTDKYESGFYLLVDQYKIGVDEGWIHYRTKKLGNISFEDIINRPTTLSGYKITDGSNSIKDNTIEDPSTKYPEFVYPYKKVDDTFNYALYKKVNDYYEYFNLMLYHMQLKMNEEEALPIWTHAIKNSEILQDIQRRWAQYSLISNKTVPEQHQENVGTHNEVLAKYNELYAIMYE